MLTTVHPTLNGHEYYMRPACVAHAVWHHFILVPSTSFFLVPWSVLWLRHQFVTDVTAWLITPNPSCSKNRKWKIKEKKNQIKEKIKNEWSPPSTILTWLYSIFFLFIYFYFWFSFSFFVILDLGERCDMILCIIVTYVIVTDHIII